MWTSNTVVSKVSAEESFKFMIRLIDDVKYNFCVTFWRSVGQRAGLDPNPPWRWGGANKSSKCGFIATVSICEALEPHWMCPAHCKPACARTHTHKIFLIIHAHFCKYEFLYILGGRRPNKNQLQQTELPQLRLNIFSFKKGGNHRQHLINAPLFDYLWWEGIRKKNGRLCVRNWHQRAQTKLSLFEVRIQKHLQTNGFVCGRSLKKPAAESSFSFLGYFNKVLTRKIIMMCLSRCNAQEICHNGSWLMVWYPPLARTVFFPHE